MFSDTEMGKQKAGQNTKSTGNTPKNIPVDFIYSQQTKQPTKREKLASNNASVGMNIEGIHKLNSKTQITQEINESTSKQMFLKRHINTASE